MKHKVVIQKADLDTCLTALVLGVSPTDEIVVVRQGADPEDLKNPSVLCIEAGGSGQIHLNNFDHHNSENLPTACEQALAVRGGNERIQKLVKYVAAVDANLGKLRRNGQPVPQPTLSAIFSGMKLCVKDQKEQFLRGMELLRTVLKEQLDPFGAMPARPEWAAYLEAKQKNDAELEKAKANARCFTSKSGLTIGFLETEYVGALGLLYQLGCQVGIVYNPRYGEPPVKKYTIGSREEDVRVDGLLEELNKLDPGWGGRERVIGSPLGKDSRLEPEEVAALVAGL